VTILRYVVAVFLLACAWLASAASMPSFEGVRSAWQPSEAWLLDRHGEVLQEQRMDFAIRRTAWVPLQSVSPALLAALLAAEDQRFFKHAGVDWLALGHAAFENLWQARPRGASTLSMQLVGLLAPHLRASQGRRSVAQKWDQMGAARELERHWSKTQILEAYLNLLPMRGELVGIDATARALFDKRPSGLDAAESILVAALIRSPNAKPDAVARRACGLAEALPRAPSCAALTQRVHTTLAGRYPILASAGDAPQLARLLLKRSGQRVVSSLDAGLQARVRDTLDRQLRRLSASNVGQAGALVLDNASGEVLAYVSANPTTADETDAVQARRQAGSTLKPFLYAMALDSRILTAASPIQDRPLALATASGQYAPDNYDHRYRGAASLRYALAGSLNIPAVTTVALLGEEWFADRLRALGFAGLTEDADFYGPSLALGTLDVSLLELANAYRSLANGGRTSPIRFQVAAGRTAAGSKVFTPQAAFLVADILSDRQARSPTFGLDSVLATRSWSAVKTGTSKDMRDNWCVGFSDRYTVGVWVGNFDGSPMHDVSGISGAAPAWREIMDHLHANRPSRAPRPPKGLEAREIVPPEGEPPRREWFLARQADVHAASTLAQPATRIVAPVDGAVLAWDPDIPASVQGLQLLAEPVAAGLRWRMDDVELAEPWWTIMPGEHGLQLLDADGRELDRIRFRVR